MTTIDFRSDNTHGCSPEIAAALARAGEGTLSSYGRDEITARVAARCAEIFEHDVEVFPVISGTAGNALAIATMTPPWGSVFCHEDAHIHREEMGAVEFFSGGAKLVPIRGDGGKMNVDELQREIRLAPVPACISVTNATEAGTVYSPDEMRAFKSAGLPLHVDGARFANAVVATSASPADLTWRAGADALTFGCTKNGTLGADAIVVFRPELASELAIRYHRAGHRASKMRLLSVQLEAYLTNDVWLRNARHANAMAARLREGVASVSGVEVIGSVDANVLFVRMPKNAAKSLEEKGFLFFDWAVFGDDAYRLVTAFDTSSEEVDSFVAALRGAQR
jgi:threonine aldolase